MKLQAMFAIGIALWVSAAGGHGPADCLRVVQDPLVSVPVILVDDEDCFVSSLPLGRGDERRVVVRIQSGVHSADKVDDEQSAESDPMDDSIAAAVAVFGEALRDMGFPEPSERKPRTFEHQFLGVIDTEKSELAAYVDEESLLRLVREHEAQQFPEEPELQGAAYFNGELYCLYSGDHVRALAVFDANRDFTLNRLLPLDGDDTGGSVNDFYVLGGEVALVTLAWDWTDGGMTRRTHLRLYNAKGRHEKTIEIDLRPYWDGEHLHFVSNRELFRISAGLDITSAQRQIPKTACQAPSPNYFFYGSERLLVRDRHVVVIRGYDDPCQICITMSPIDSEGETLEMVLDRCCIGVINISDFDLEAGVLYLRVLESSDSNPLVLLKVNLRQQSVREIGRTIKGEHPFLVETTHAR